jgi:hypothetical protein
MNYSQPAAKPLCWRLLHFQKGFLEHKHIPRWLQSFTMGRFAIPSGGEGRILLPPLLLSGCDAYTSVIIPCVCAGYKRIRCSATARIGGFKL